MLTLNRMEIQGFKSFYGRTLFEFRPGITAVVGPNGCGKSNVGDAIAWVLGDQSPRSLRADRMLDVIFNGSDARKPMGMAEVTLRFLGSNGGPEPGEDFVVTRRLYRSGDSEYSLNGARCRLRDIQELLVRSQVGSRLYSVIEQGKVDQILSSKPKDRRTLFEEAAGILGYKSKRRIALGKLEATQANLVRIHDILAEVEKQSGSLRRQVAKARRYQRIQETLRGRRGIFLRARLMELEREEQTTSAARRELADREAELSAALARCEAEVESLRNRFEEAEAEARRGRERLNETDREMDRNRILLERSREQVTEARGAVERWGDDATALARRLAEREEKHSERTALLETARRELESLELSLRGKEAEQGHRVEAARRSEEDSEATRAELLLALDRLAELRGRGERIGQDLRRLSERRRELESESGAARKERERIQVEQEELTVLSESRTAELERVRGEHQAAEESRAAEGPILQQIAEDREGLARKIAQTEERLRALEEAEHGFPGSGQGVSAVLTGAREGKLRTRGRVADCVEVEPGWVPAAEAALGDFLGAVVVEEPEEALAGIRYLKEAACGRCGFLSLSGSGAPSRVPPAELLADARCVGTLSGHVHARDGLGEVLRAELEGTILVPDLEAALDLRQRHPGWSFVTAEGDRVARTGLIHGGTAGPQEKGLLARRRERHEHEERLRTEREKYGRMEREREQREGSRRILAERLAVLEDRMRETEREVMEARLRRDQRQEELERILRTLRVAEEERHRLECDETALTAERSELSESLAAAEGRRRELEQAIASAARNLASRREEMAAGADSLGFFRSRVAVERQRIASLEGEVATCAQSVGEEAVRLARAREEARASAEQVASLEDRIASLGAALESGRRERGEASAKLETVESDAASLKTELLAAEQSAKSARGLLEALRVRVSESEVAVARLGVELRHLETACREELGFGLQELRALPPPEPETSLAALEKEIAELKARLERVGAVNLVALEQYREMAERHAFLAGQKEDLDKSIESLNETIRKINRTSRDKFLEAFRHIQEGFNRCFVTLFGGGRAELRMMEDEDILECGIEIIASPPGKRLQSISLLSGGEKAMTAVALLFAIFRYRPSPFCVLDEVDAALDEANVSRFTRMLRDLTPGTQFILITHNRRSMEVADLLYGITMEEPGISKVVSMRLDN